MKKIILFFYLLITTQFYSQCNIYSGCNPNTGLYSDNDAANIDYDNIITAFHTSVVKDAFDNYKIWGAYAHANGKDPVLSPQYINAVNYPGLTGRILKVALGSMTTPQLIVLTTDGLFVSGYVDSVIPKSIKSTENFEKITVNGNNTGLPAGVFPGDVKMMFATTKSLTITTCSGRVFVLSSLLLARGNGQKGNDYEWSMVMENATTPLSDIIVARGQYNMGLALKNDGTLWTWGENVFSGKITDGRNDSYDYATQMVLPAGITGIKMIQVTAQGASNYHTYYILDNNNTLYCLGYNINGSFGFRTYPIVKTWTPSQYPNGSIANDIAWISANEHDYFSPNIGIINKSGSFYTAGDNSGFMIGQSSSGTGIANYFKIPNGILATDVITSVEVGGHCTAAIKKGVSRYGYVGHRIQGSMGDNIPDSDSLGIYEDTFDFVTTPVINVCGVSCTEPIIENNAPVCYNEQASFFIKSTPGDIVTYSLNNNTEQNITIDNTGSYQITIPETTNKQILKISKFSNLVCSQSVNIVSETEIINNSNISVQETGKNSVNIIVLGGTPQYEYQLLDEDGFVVAPWQKSNSFINLSTNYYKIQIRTEGTACISSYDFIFIDLPNVITPNSDGKNDNLKLTFLKKSLLAKLEIYDRYGKKMLSLDSNNLNQQDYTKFASGTYWYIFTNDSGAKKSGWIVIKKN